MATSLVRLLSACLTALVMLCGTASAVDVTGVWMSEDGDTKVKVTDCGGALCGTVVWLKEPIDPKTGNPRTDKFNPDPGKRSRPMLGLQVVNGLRPAGPDVWVGPIYHADEGLILNVTLQVDNPRQARMRGCVLAVLCKTERWTRVE